MKTFMIMIIAAFASLFLIIPASAAGARIELNQSNPVAGDTVTFTVSQASGAKEIRLVCGDARDVNQYPPVSSVQDETKPVGSSFVLASGNTTCVAWLLKRGEPLVGTLFWVA